MEKGRGKGTDTLQTNEVFARKEYIEREAAIDRVYDCCMESSSCNMNCIKDIPAADIVPVRHGRWIELENGDCKCSLCGCYHHTWEAHGYYCQHCGALMDDKDGDGE